MIDPHKRREKAKKLWASGKSMRDVAAELGTNRNAVWRWVHGYRGKKYKTTVITRKGASSDLK
jgi:hypothetical protein